jgi:hypothetical protein
MESVLNIVTSAVIALNRSFSVYDGNESGKKVKVLTKNVSASINPRLRIQCENDFQILLYLEKPLGSIST